MDAKNYSTESRKMVSNLFLAVYRCNRFGEKCGYPGSPHSELRWKMASGLMVHLWKALPASRKAICAW